MKNTLFAGSNSRKQGRLGWIHVTACSTLHQDRLAGVTLSLCSSVDRVFLVHAHEIAIFMKNALRVVRHALLPQVGDIRQTSDLLKINLVVLSFLSLDLAVVSRPLSCASLPLVLENFESLLAVGLSLFEGISLPDYISKKSRD